VRIALFILFFSFFPDTATTEIYTLSLHDALPIYIAHAEDAVRDARGMEFLERVEFFAGADELDRLAGDSAHRQRRAAAAVAVDRSEEHTSELQSRSDLVCRLLLEKKKSIKCTWWL